MCAGTSWEKGGERGGQKTLSWRAEHCSLLTLTMPHTMQQCWQKHHSKNHRNRLLVSYRFYTDPFLFVYLWQIKLFHSCLHTMQNLADTSEYGFPVVSHKSICQLLRKRPKLKVKSSFLFKLIPVLFYWSFLVEFYLIFQPFRITVPTNNTYSRLQNQ